MNEINQNLIFIQKIIDDVINDSFTPKDKKDFQLFLKKLNTSIPEILLIFLENQQHFTDKYNNLDLSKTNELVDFINPLSSKLKLDGYSSELLFKYFTKITSIVFTKYKNDYPEITKPISDLYRENIFFIERGLSDVDCKPIKNVSFSRFRFKKNKSVQCRIFFSKLKFLKKIDEDTLFENFEIIFSLKKPNKNFQKVNWIDSYFQLKLLIKSMMDQKIIDFDVDYNKIIINCFYQKDKEITLKNLDARGEIKTVNYQYPLLKEIFDKK